MLLLSIGKKIKEIGMEFIGKRKLYLHRLLSKGHTHMVLYLLEVGPEDRIRVWIKARDRDGLTALHMAAAMDSEEVVEQLILCGSDIHAVDRSGMTALHYAAAYGTLEAVKTLLRYGADSSKKDAYERNPASIAGERANFEIANLLMHKRMVTPSTKYKEMVGMMMGEGA